jgi:hypothetical protein
MPLACLLFCRFGKQGRKVKPALFLRVGAGSGAQGFADLRGHEFNAFVMLAHVEVAQFAVKVVFRRHGGAECSCGL